MVNPKNNDFNDYREYMRHDISNEINNKKKGNFVLFSHLHKFLDSSKQYFIHKFNKIIKKLNKKDITNSPFISYRSKEDKYSRFINVHELLKSKDPNYLLKIYEGIFKSVTAYEAERSKTMIEVESSIYRRIISLIEENESILEKEPNIRIEAENIHTEFQEKLEMMKIRGKEKIKHPKEAFLQELERDRDENMIKELERLKSLPRVKKALNTVKEKLTSQAKSRREELEALLMYNPELQDDPSYQRELKLIREDLTLEQQLAFGHSVELQEKLKKTHYVFNHGQNLTFIVKNLLVKQLNKIFKPDNFQSYEPLRSDKDIQHLQDIHNSEWAKKEVMAKTNLDQDLRDELISADCYLESIKDSESALFFLMENTNIALIHDNNFLKDMMLKIISNYIPDKEVGLKLLDNLIKLMEKYPNGGNIYSICIPKEDFDNSCYFSEPLGKPYSKEEEASYKEALESYQSGDEAENMKVPQIRILTHKLKPENDYHVLLNSTMQDKEISNLENEIILAIQAALTGYRIGGSD